MKLTARIDETRVHYALASWSWDKERLQLTQRIPLIEGVRFIIPDGASETFDDVSTHNAGPTFGIGQEIKLGDRKFYVSFIEIIPTTKENGQLFFGYIYTVSELPPEITSFWTTEVQEFCI